MNCEEIADRLTESARREMEPGRGLRAHMLSCAACRDRWEAEESLTAHMKTLRAVAWNQRSSVASREILLERFARQNRAPVISRFWVPRFWVHQWYWAFGAVAALVIGAVAVSGLQHRFAIPVRSVSATGSDYVSEIQTDLLSDPEAEGFIAVPFVPPLATGETLRMVHTELNPAALASLGVSVDPAWTTQLPADVLFGEDGMPRAVRISDVSSDSGGF